MRLEHTLWWRHLLHILNKDFGPALGADIEEELLAASHRKAMKASYAEEDEAVTAMLRGEPPC